MSDPLFELDGVTKQFGSLVAVDDVSFSLSGGNEGITALIGPNGAGKTTTYNLLTGKLKPTEGDIMFKGERINDLSPAERTKKGMGRSFQITNIFEGLTARRNIRIPIVARSDSRYDPFSDLDEDEDIATEVDRLLDLVGLTDIADTKCANLSYGDKRRVEIGITLATDPDLVLLDEPTAGMNPEETEKLVDLIADLDEETETTFFLTEHDMNVVFSIASRILVLNQGRIIADQTPQEITQNEQVQSAYLGSEGDEAFTIRTEEREVADKRDRPVVLDVDDIHTSYGQSQVLTGVSLEVHEGEIVSLLGRNGAGKTTTLRSIVGVQPPHRGGIRFRGDDITHKAPFQIARAGIGYVPEERDIFTELTVADNLELTAARTEDSSDWTLERIYDLFPRLEERQTNKGYQLSGGEQQMLTVARALISDPDLLVLDEPSEGLAPVIVDDLQEILGEVIETGITVLMTEQNVEFALSLAERNYILNNGRIEWQGTTEELLDDRSAIERYISLSGLGEDAAEAADVAGEEGVGD
jgi:branched-chain amino acid transport system ATP-binding protein